MELSLQLILDLAIGLAAFFGAWVLKTISAAVNDLRKRDDSLSKEVHAIHILIAGDYVKRAELEKIFTEMFSSLRRIEDKLDQKVDKA